MRCEEENNNYAKRLRRYPQKNYGVFYKTMEKIFLIIPSNYAVTDMWNKNYDIF
jgi:hypothetical protein